MSNFHKTLNRWCDNPFFPLVFLPLAAFMLCLCTEATSPLFLNDGTDSAIFKSIGLGILKGKIPYVDIFDHKGPVIFFINALGQWIHSGRPGIFLLEIISLSAALLVLFRTSRLYVDGCTAFLCTLVSLVFFGTLVTEGDQCEEWELPFLCLSFYYALSHIAKGGEKAFPFKESAILGFCFAFVFLIRPNDGVSIPGGIMLYLTVASLLRKQYKGTLVSIAGFAAGAAVLSLPVFAYFLYHGAFFDLVNGTVLANASYAGGFKETLLSCLGHGKQSLALIFIALMCLAATVDRKSCYLLALVSLLTFIFIGPRLYIHYHMVLIPSIGLMVTYMFLAKDKPLVVLSLAVLLLSPQAGTDGFLKMGRKAFQLRVQKILDGQKDIARLYEQTDRLIDIIPEEERDEIWNYNLDWDNKGKSTFSLLIHRNLVQSNIVTFGGNEEIKRRDDIRNHSPKWLLKDNRMTPLWERVYLLDPERLEYIDTHFDLVARTDTTVCDVALYRWKD